ncbi:hypothetical protein OS493_020395 [Desmophyllum pertusum]|uniref:Solute carrier family 46 member 3 n=1 Tax=Desmophyllum pertusum TaxID=174260 RepID=A0A9W9ZBS3_9CNID|nr:hypothetical protein OS493_020395 [Desmophyllum pertusum]
MFSCLLSSAPVVGIFTGTIRPLFRGMMSRIVGVDEQGALFSASASLETLCNFIGAFIFNSMYPASLKFNFPGFVFFLGTIILIIPLLLIWNPESSMSEKNLHRASGLHREDHMEHKLIATVMNMPVTLSSASSPRGGYSL